MKAAFGPQKPVQLVQLPGNGAFSLDIDGQGSVAWHTCREGFAGVFTPEIPGFFFSLKPGSEDNCADFIQKTEEIIDIEKLGHKHTVFSKATKPHCLWIKPSSFWSSCEIRRSFLTVLCRCGVNYTVNNEKDNYEDALFSVNYFQLTQDATKRFLFGFTNTEKAAKTIEGQSSGSRGWHYVFSNKTALQVKQLLGWPTGLPKPELPIGLIEKEALWA